MLEDNTIVSEGVVPATTDHYSPLVVRSWYDGARGDKGTKDQEMNNRMRSRKQQQKSVQKGAGWILKHGG